GPRGVVIGNATCFPVSMARGATWDPDLEERVGDAIGRELRASGATLYGGVCVNLLRHPAWGRAQETYGEDPHHVGELGAALVRGVQRHAMATVKHFAVNSMENARFRVDVRVDDVALHEVFLPHFRRIVEEGAACVMSAYNRLNGTYCGDHHDLLTGILRDEWGFDGFVISDWIFGMRDAAESLRAGLDIEMPYRMVRATHLPIALEAGTASWDDVRAAVTRIIATLLRFDSVLSVPAPSVETIGSDGHVSLAREVAGRSVVLLRNEPVAGRPVLPLDASSLRSIAVIGSLADRVNLGDGGSSDVFSLDNVTILAGIAAAAPHAEVVHHDGDALDGAIEAARGSDVAIVVVGYTADDEGEFIGDPGIDLRHLFPERDDDGHAERFRAEPRIATVRPEHVRSRHGLGFSVGGDRSTLQLAEGDEALIRAVSAANARTVVVLQAGSAVIVAGWVDRVPAVVQAWYGGQQAGHGLADVLFGAVNPSARLPFTVPSDPSHLPQFDRDADAINYDQWHGWWRAERLGLRPQYPFGFGLSYTAFEISGTSVEDDEDCHRVSCTLSNTGLRDGADVVQVYARYGDEAVPSRLVGFQRVEVPAGTSVHVTIEVPRSRLTRRDPATRSWREPRGPVELVAARHAPN
ncbi:MAG: glycoside hydrolase family 3 C-terminal domain-containing protein, partial [Acidobacteria bacterium]|nr:glycoside hydrolase family 3 C-terminal domain-containing protein [Acidobacteriota bacterium]